MKKLLTLSLVAVNIYSWGQGHQSSVLGGKKPASPPKEVELPTKEVDFKNGKAIPGVSASPIVVVPAQCTSDGTLFLDMLDISDPRKHTVYSIQGQKGKEFSPGTISDLQDVAVISFFPSRSAVAFLISASESAQTSDGATDNPGAGTHTSEGSYLKPHYYIAKFDLNGLYKGSIKLPMDYPVFRVASFSSGEFLASGYDAVNQTPRLLLLDSKGNIERPIQLQASILNSVDTTDEYGSPRAVAEEGKLLSSITFTSFGDRVLAWRSGGNDPVLEIGAGGSVREVPVQAPDGYVLSDFIPSTNAWVARFRPRAWSEDVAHDNGGYRYYSLNPSDGGLLRRLTLPANGPGLIACEANGAFIAYETDKDGQLVRLSAD